MIFMIDSTATLEGYAFTCMQCGCCCYQTKGISITEKERKKIGEHPSIAPLESSSFPYTHRILPLDEGKCPFLENNQCTIYEKRPEICRRFPLTIRYAPDIGYLYSAIVCCGAKIESKIESKAEKRSKREKETKSEESSSFPFEGYTKTLDPRFLSSFKKQEKRNLDVAFALSRSVNATPLVADMEPALMLWDFIGELAYQDVLYQENLQWMSWVIMKVWYQFFLDELGKENVLTKKKIPRITSRARKQFPEYANSQLDHLEKVKEEATYISGKSGNDSQYILPTCKKTSETLKVPLSDKERSYAQFTQEALELSRNYYRFLARRTIRVHPFRSSVIPIAFVPEILHRTVTNVTGSAVLLAKHRGHTSVTGDDLFDVIKLQDDPRKVNFYKDLVLKTYGFSILII